MKINILFSILLLLPITAKAQNISYKKFIYFSIFDIDNRDSIIANVIIRGDGQDLMATEYKKNNTNNTPYFQLPQRFTFQVEGYKMLSIFTAISDYWKQSRNKGNYFYKTDKKQRMEYTQDESEKGEYYRYHIYLEKVSTLEEIAAPTNAIDIFDTTHVAFNPIEYRLSKLLNYLVPSYNSTQQPISDASAHFDVNDLRGLGSSRTLILVNNKRRHFSSTTYLTDAYSKGDVALDLESIPISAIDKIEVLRDGASVRYGSDAIAGVINLHLKKRKDFSLNTFSNITSQGDGFVVGYNVSKTIEAENAHLNIAHSLFNQTETNRLKSFISDEIDSNLTQKDKEWIKENPTLNMRFGLPNMLSSNVSFNGGIFIDNEKKNELYAFGGFSYRKGRSYAFYRTPFFNKLQFGRDTLPFPFYFFHDSTQNYQGFQPTFDVDVFDNNLTVGIRNGENFDISYTCGSNYSDYTVNESLNTTMGTLSPSTFNVGGYGSSHNVIDFNMQKSWHIDNFLEKVKVYGGTQFRTDKFIERVGEEASYTNYLAERDSTRYKSAGGFFSYLGTISFPGISPLNAIEVTRYNIGLYSEVELDLRHDIMVVLGGRYEKYNDYSTPVPNWKVGLKYKIGKFNLRGSTSTNFRAPALHQIYLSTIQTTTSTGNLNNQGTFNNISPIMRALGVQRLESEKSLNITFGVQSKLIDNDNVRLNASIDYYNITLKDRIVYSADIEDTTKKSNLYRILQDYNISSLKFFTNSIETNTQGLDLALNLDYNTEKSRRLQLYIGANWTVHKILSIFTPDAFLKSNVNIFDSEEQARVLTYRPNFKVLLNAKYDMENWGFNIRSTTFGKVSWQGRQSDDISQEFMPKHLLDLIISYRFGLWDKNMSIQGVVNNALNTYPDNVQAKPGNIQGRFLYSRPVQQFNINGRTFAMNLKIDL